MSILGSILEKLGFGSAHASPQTAPDPSVTPPAGDTTTATGTVAPAIDEQVQAKLAELKQANSGLNPQTSIVDLLKALGMDSSFEHRKELAKEVGIDPYEGTQTQNTKLHEAVLNKASQ